ncbi:MULTISPECIES: phosphatidate cytidylyltransferase [Vibrio]|uniref:Phosphatidate cytidylyltransferase n=1 Tax=Vibrio algicola TaxID=2662262 RepID=A0A5Q0TEW6_9VIBR|nr:MULTISPECIES: phosphatidate cytidylyltransferase [Vibrio]MBD1575078.1 phosphatidate cytidylyltransferase [Vibrio sp. S11_S32]
MKQRIITALILAPLVVLGIFLLPIPFFILALTAIAMLGFWEWTQFVEPKSRIMSLLPALVAVAASFFFIPFDSVSLGQASDVHYAILSTGSMWWLVASLLALTYPRSTCVWQKNIPLRHIFGILSLLPFLWSVFMLRAVDYAFDPLHGAKLVMYVCLLVWAADTGAYFTGKAIGKHKMAPKVSPNKTIEGLLGGVVLAMVIGWFVAKLFNIHFASLTTMLLITFVTVVISVLGDLVESMFKRVSNIKDSSNIIPGHGGILDRIDSLMAAFPVFALLYFFCQ